ncbi:PREDICTED: histone deacetylase 6 [Tarenaya hassleriana]|uniref:histone deacetylase 6 n=1 Tax=Tarenaya hassleriana TaxID=28532 RepID=UPI00053C5C10|nr:PREDICTED: histone deacetylase 6 [Tarenaya hassleriana]
MANRATASSSSSQQIQQDLDVGGRGGGADEEEDWVFGAGSGWIEARTWCDHLQSLSPDLSNIPAPDSPCARCQNPVENWLCLCCEEVLCSRFVNRHMLSHYHQTGHCLALSYSDLSVWCFCCDAYLDGQAILQLRPIYTSAYILKFGEAPPLPEQAASSASSA